MKPQPTLILHIRRVALSLSDTGLPSTPLQSHARTAEPAAGSGGVRS